MNAPRLLLAILLITSVACSGERPADSATTSQPATEAKGDNKLVLYSGRNEKLVGPLLARFTRETGIQVEARYGETAEMAATLIEEGRRSPADAFLAQDAAALGAVSRAGLTRPLPSDVISRIPARFAGPDGSWVGISGRARTVVYNPKRIRPEQLPRSLEEIGTRATAGRWGIAPLNASLQSHLAVFHATQGREALEQLLDAMVKASPRRYPRNGAIVDAVASGEIDWGLVNHYYVWEAKKERPDLAAENFFMPEGSASSFVNVAGIALIDDDPDALRLIEFLLSDEAQQYFATETFEYPLVAGVAAPVALQPLEELRTPEIDFARVSAVLPETLGLINERGLSRN
ncbi:MAG TPA: extracellular solute-binding protein [Thermoanaerobaculia bacterium]